MLKKYKFPLLVLILGLIVTPLIVLQMVYVDSNGIVHEPGLKLMPVILLSLISSLIWIGKIKLTSPRSK
ncbi:DUF3955 domain-containing protein [Enterococcus faecium]|uniref:DUF3955 domain-containing protein n=1 Tax=Enterococcus TaxID=1350 RepID=UPI001386D0EF|nr:DUF3955 domain-containing protein [Enterococcus hirae]MCD5218498.1 DUF3955 domain-containing protein [Enterococcus faecium]